MLENLSSMIGAKQPYLLQNPSPMVPVVRQSLPPKVDFLGLITSNAGQALPMTNGFPARLRQLRKQRNCGP
jgi:hypothetical protein